MAKDKKSEGPILIGRIVATFGLKGQVKVEPLTNISERFAVGAVLLLDGSPRKILESRTFKGRFILRLEGIKKIEEAEALKWKELYASSDDPIALDENEFMVDDLVGMKVVDHQGHLLGMVDEIQSFPAHDLIVVGKLLIPAVTEFVELVDFETGTITVRLLEGMVESD